MTDKPVPVPPVRGELSDEQITRLWDKHVGETRSLDSGDKIAFARAILASSAPRPAAQMGPQPITAREIMAAVARGWRHPQNAGKEMDPSLAFAISAEVNDLVGRASAGKPAPSSAPEGGKQ
jgi:hypothetical protein